MKPITRIERYLAYITRDEDSTEIDDPIIRVEMYLAKIAGIEVEIPERPITRVEMYLAKIAGEDVDIPDRPITRIEMYLAAIAGEEREVPDPITRVEQYLYAWVNLGPAWEIVTITGVSPLALQKALQQPIRSLTQFGKCVQDGADILCNNGALKYGATGKNLIDPSSLSHTTYTVNSDGSITVSSADGRAWSNIPEYSLKAGTYTISATGFANNSQCQFRTSEDSYDTTQYLRNTVENRTFTLTSDGGIKLKVGTGTSDYPVVFKVQIESGSTATAYEPYTEGIYTDGAPEVLTITATGEEDQTATVENLFAVDDIVDEQDIITGKVIRRTEAVVSDGTTPSGRYVGEVGVGNIIIKARETGYSGEIVSFTTEDETPLNGIRVNFEPIQDLHGYDSPWPAGGGKNLLWLNNGVFKTGDFRENRQLTGIGTWVGMSASNYLAPNNIVSYTIGDNSLTVEAKSNGYGVGIECKLTAGQQYTLSWVGTHVYVGISFYDGDGAQLSYVTTGASPKTFTVPESTANAIIVLRGDAANVTGEFSNIQLEEGQTATAYSPYANICPISGYSEAKVYVSPTQDAQDATVYTIDLDGARYGGTLDVTAGTLTVDRAYAVFDGSSDENWRMHGTIASWFYTDNALTNVFTDASASNFSISNAYKQSPYSTVANIENGKFAIGYSSGSAVLRTVFKDTRYTTVQEWTDALATNHIQLCYKLATPQTIQLTPQQVELLLGENNIWSNGKSVNVYVPSGDVVEQVTPQKLKTAQGTNTVSVVSNVDPVALEVEYTAEAS